MLLTGSKDRAPHVLDSHVLELKHVRAKQQGTQLNYKGRFSMNSKEGRGAGLPIQ